MGKNNVRNSKKPDNVKFHSITPPMLDDPEIRFAGLVDNVNLGILRSLPETPVKIIEANRAMETITGYTRNELLYACAFCEPSRLLSNNKAAAARPDKASNLSLTFFYDNYTEFFLHSIAPLLKESEIKHTIQAV